MGILDDAIRQHLDLKRRLGADDDELKRLEDEAFGPPTRPGDPDFPETDPGASQTLGELADAPATGPGATAAVAEPEAPAAETPAIDSPPAEEPEPTEPPPDLPADPGPDTGETQIEPEPEPELPATGANAPEPPASEASTAFYDQAGGTQEAEAVPEPPHAAEEQVLEPDSAEQPIEPEAQEVAPAEAELVNEPLSEELPAAPQSGEPPIESLDTVEHHFEGAIEDTGEEEVLEAEVVEGEIAEDEDGEAEDDDVLDQTPEFLRDRPEDDELWFEQGEPKDFDF